MANKFLSEMAIFDIVMTGNKYFGEKISSQIAIVFVLKKTFVN